MRRVLILLAVGFCSACSSGRQLVGGDVGAACSRQEECGAGFVCKDSRCAQSCEADPECGAGMQCTGGVCTSADAAPRIISVNGSGSADAAAGHAVSNVRDRLVITVEKCRAVGFTYAAASLSGALG